MVQVMTSHIKCKSNRDYIKFKIHEIEKCCSCFFVHSQLDRAFFLCTCSMQIQCLTRYKMGFLASVFWHLSRWFLRYASKHPNIYTFESMNINMNIFARIHPHFHSQLIFFFAYDKWKKLNPNIHKHHHKSKQIQYRKIHTNTSLCNNTFIIMNSDSFFPSSSLCRRKSKINIL